MTPKTNGADIAQRLEAAIERLHDDVRRVEIWAGALRGFAQAVPTYQANDDFLMPARADEPPEKPARRV